MSEPDLRCANVGSRNVTLAQSVPYKKLTSALSPNERRKKKRRVKKEKRGGVLPQGAKHRAPAPPKKTNFAA